ncbi:hypothetical protein JOB18_006913 [Solea senegalensis]|uniref:Uncharacterized protein n=1 Tax=Solea senegalensis TaxID=28829 RepID=A0AAV6RM82_SOLSE|nr:hypothetical protein JOB18_006913 [Solea senegalensis]
MLEMEYADDVDFVDEEKDTLHIDILLLPKAAKNLKESKLFVNEGNTEFTHIYLAETQERGENDEPLQGVENWRKTYLMCSRSGVQRKSPLMSPVLDVHAAVRTWDTSRCANMKRHIRVIVAQHNQHLGRKALIPAHTITRATDRLSIIVLVSSHHTGDMLLL